MAICVENFYPESEAVMSKRFRVILCTIFIWFLGIQSYAQSQYSSVLTKMENSLFGIDYNNQSDDARLNRIEQSVYGAASSSPEAKRIDKLKNDLAVDVVDQKIKAKCDSFEDSQDSPAEAIPKADSNVNYPIVNELEKRVFNKEFKTNEINQRLSSLEQNVFKKTYNDDLNARVDRLRVAVMPEKTFVAEDNDNSQYYESQDDTETGAAAPDDLAGVPSYNQNNSVLDDYQGEANITVPLSALEKKMLRKSFPDDTVANRLTRLEMKEFSSTFPDDDEQTRLGRIASAYQAKKTSSKYDSNKFAQHAATAMQVGAILLMILAAIL